MMLMNRSSHGVADLFLIAQHDVGPRFKELGHVKLVTRSNNLGCLWSQCSNQMQNGQRIAARGQCDHDNSHMFQMQMFQNLRITSIANYGSKSKSFRSGNSC